MSTISLHLPASLHGSLRDLAQREGTSINQLIVTAVAEKLSALETESLLAARAARGSREAFDRALEKVKDRDPPDDDRL